MQHINATYKHNIQTQHTNTTYKHNIQSQHINATYKLNIFNSTYKHKRHRNIIILADSLKVIFLDYSLEMTSFLNSNSIVCVVISCYFTKLNGQDWTVSMVTIIRLLVHIGTFQFVLIFHFIVLPQGSTVPTIEQKQRHLSRQQS